MGTYYNLLRPADAQLASYEVDDDSTCRCQVITILGMTASGCDMVITKLDTCLIAILSNATRVQQVYCNPQAGEQMEVEEILAEIGFLLPVKEEVGVA